MAIGKVIGNALIMSEGSGYEFIGTNGKKYIMKTYWSKCLLCGSVKERLKCSVVKSKSCGCLGGGAHKGGGGRPRPKRKETPAKYNADNLTNIYIKNLIAKRTFTKSKDIPQWMVELKREQIKLYREIYKRKMRY